MSTELREPKSSLRNNIMISFFLITIIGGIFITVFYRQMLDHTLIREGLSEAVANRIVSDFIAVSTGVTIAGTVAVLLIAVFLSNTITAPIRKLTEGVIKIARGDLDSRIDIKGEDELGQLTEGFNHMAEQIKEAMIKNEAAREYTEGIVATIPSLLIIINKDLDILSSNATPEKFDFSFPLRLFVRELEDGIMQCIESGESSSREVTIAPSGSARDIVFMARVSPIVSTDKTETDDPRILLTLTDITIQKTAEEETKNYHIKLEKLVKKRTDELDKRIYEAEQLNKGMVNLLQDLQSSYRQKNDLASKLQSANRELESFSYSVSHDLRAPLRAINGFSNALLEDHAGQIDDEGKRFLGLIRDNALNMGNLIDSLLEFSRLGRKSMEMDHIDMEALAGRVYDQCKMVEAGREPEVIIGSLPPAYGDPVMINQVLFNLVSNAIKYSAKKEKPVIEIGGDVSGEENIYYVKDNGVGFNMEYSGKLFGVFQRLHRTEEFEGTGVGLATVQRIILRHNGRVWGEGKENEGATFYFSLPKKEHIYKMT